MIRIACYALFGLVGLLIQTSIFPNVLPFQFKPDLILILVVYLGICQKYGYSGVLSFCFGLLYDVFGIRYQLFFTKVFIRLTHTL